jgi:hypothetical protein
MPLLVRTAGEVVKPEAWPSDALPIVPSDGKPEVVRQFCLTAEQTTTDFSRSSRT